MARPYEKKKGEEESDVKRGPFSRVRPREPKRIVSPFATSSSKQQVGTAWCDKAVKE